ncbi:MAG: hypothetical protein KAT13_03275 [Methanosarcinales archaeon]|jgi:hypothetical protein|nr:hypothetical protein [Methanosarcinales archaeon]
MNLNEFIEYVESASAEYSLKVGILARTKNAIKIRLKISPIIFVQFYHHQKLNTSNYVLVGWNRLLYGRDSVGGEWHRHPFHNPLEHDTSCEGMRAVTPSEFLEEVFELLQEEKLI